MNALTQAAKALEPSALLAAWGAQLDDEMVVLALTHRSFANEHGHLPTNERLEFLGDAVLQLIVTERLYRTYPDHPEGHLAKMRAATVSQRPLAQVARTLRLGDYLLLGKGELKTGGRDKDSILSDTVEALIGATYLTHGMEVTRRVVETQLAELLDAVVERGASMDWKTRVQELVLYLGLGDILYETTGTGPDHNRTFHSRLLVDGKVWGEGSGPAKKVAEHIAARCGLDAIAAHYDVEGARGFGDFQHTN